MINEAMMQSLARRGRQENKILYSTQVRVAPPTFFFLAMSEMVHFSYLRYLETHCARILVLRELHSPVTAPNTEHDNC